MHISEMAGLQGLKHYLLEASLPGRNLDTSNMFG